MKIFYIVQLLFIMTMGLSNGVAGSIQQQVAALASSADENGVVQGKDGWLFLKEELEHLGSTAFYGEGVLKTTKAVKPEFGDPLPAILDFHTQLKERGIELIFVPIPPKAMIYPDKLPGDVTLEMAAQLDQPYEELYARLSEQDVQVLDLIPVFRKARAKEQLYCKTDTHFSGNGIAVVAQELNQIIQKSTWYPGITKKKYQEEKRDIAIHGDLSVMQKRDTEENVSLLFVNDAINGKTEVSDPDSPVLLLGDSHTLVFSVGGDLHTNGAGLFDQLSADLGFPVDLLGVRGSGATPSRIKLYQRSRKDASFLENKKIVVWCLSARELTGSGGWRKIPVAKK